MSKRGLRAASSREILRERGAFGGSLTAVIGSCQVPELAIIIDLISRELSRCTGNTYGGSVGLLGIGKGTRQLGNLVFSNLMDELQL